MLENLGQLALDGADTHWYHQPKLGQQPADLVDLCGALNDKPLARTVQPEQRLLFGVLDRHKSHVWPPDRLAYRLGIRCIILVALDERLYELWRYQLDRVPNCSELAGPKMRSAAGLHPDQARRKLRKKSDYLRALQFPAQRNFASLVDPVHLKNILCQIEPNLRNVHRGRSCWFKWSLDTSTLAHLMPRQAGASMPLLIPVSEKPAPPLNSVHMMRLIMFAIGLGASLVRPGLPNITFSEQSFGLCGSPA